MMRFKASLWPSVWGWWAVDIRLFIILISHTSRQNSDVSLESLSETTPLGVLKRHSIALKNSSVKSIAVVSSLVGKNSAYFVTRYTIVSMLLYSWPLRVDAGRPVI